MDASTSAAARNGMAAVASVAALVLALAACGSSASSSALSGTGGSVYERLVSAYVAYAACARSHGMPNLPDPQVDDQGNDRYPSLDRQGHWSWPASVLQGCAKVWERVHAVRDRFDSQHGLGRSPSISSRAQALALARCIRAHGFPSFPDPSSNGSTSVGVLPPGFAKPNLSPQARTALSACSRAVAP
jgi:hypothetical protein